MLFRRVRVFFGVGFAIVLLASAPQMAQAAEGDVVTVYRGADATTVRLASGGPLQVKRGAAVKTVTYAASGDGVIETRKLLAGDRLWVIDTDSDRLTTCVLQKSIQVGRKEIRCFSRDLP